MDDKSEKIVFLARELLESGMNVAPAKKNINVTMTFKALCFTSFLAAAGGGIVTAAMHENLRPLNRYEKTELKALMFYTTQTKGLDETALRQELANKLGVTSFDDLTNVEFPAVRLYLQEKAQ